MDYNDPNTDFDLESANLIAALRQAQAQQATKLPEGQIIRGGRNQLIYMPSGLGSTMGALADQVYGGLQAAKLQRQQRELSAAQQSRIADLSGQLGQPSSGDPLADNARRMQIAQQMTRLPLARGLGTELWKKAADFPEQYAEQQARAEAQAAAQAERLALQERLAENTNVIKERGLGIQQQNADTRQIAVGTQVADLDRKITTDEAKRAAAADTKLANQTAAIQSTDNILRNIGMLIDDAGNLTSGGKAIFGQLDQYKPNILQDESASRASAAFEGLTDQVMLKNLAEQRKAIGQSFGSMQLKEWDKFVSVLSTLNRGKDQNVTAENLRYLRQFLANTQSRQMLEFALNGGKVANIATSSGQKALSTAVVLNGKRYLNINGKWFEQ